MVLVLERSGCFFLRTFVDLPPFGNRFVAQIVYCVGVDCLYSGILVSYALILNGNQGRS